MSTSIEEQTIKLEKETVKYLNKIANQYSFGKVIFRGFIIGLFTAIGATFGFALVLFFMSKLITGLKEVPLVDDILRQTKLDVLIETQLNTLPSSEDENTADAERLEYRNYQFDTIEFLYPDIFSLIKEVPSSAFDIKGIQFQEGNILEQLIILKNQKYDFTGSSYITIVDNPNISSSEVTVYEFGAGLTDNEDKPTFVYTFTQEEDTFTVIGIGDIDYPKLSREIYIRVVESIQ